MGKWVGGWVGGWGLAGVAYGILLTSMLYTYAHINEIYPGLIRTF